MKENRIVVREKGKKVEVQLGFLQVSCPPLIFIVIIISTASSKVINFRGFEIQIQLQVHHVYEVALLLRRDKFSAQPKLFAQIDSQV